jgi:HNH endonuclease
VPDGTCVAWEAVVGHPCGAPIAIVSRQLCCKHYGRLKRTGRLDVKSKIERFWGFVDTDGPLPTWAPFLGPCWVWTGRHGPFGHGRFLVGGKGSKQATSHRYAYEMIVGPIPDGLVLDHLCRNPSCVRPDHLEPVTQRENLLRGLTFQAANAAKTHCKRGHPFDEANTIWRKIPGSGGVGRSCRECRNAPRRKGFLAW